MPKKKNTIDVVQLDNKALEEFKEYLKQSRLAARGRRATEKSRALRDKIVALMDGALIAQFPDGRQIMRVPKEIPYESKPATVVKWDELSEVRV